MGENKLKIACLIDYASCAFKGWRLLVKWTKVDTMLYLAILLSALTLDFIPVITPPAWTILVFLLVKFHLNPSIAVPASASGSTLGRYLMSLCVPKFSKLFLKRNKHQELQFVGK